MSRFVTGTSYVAIETIHINYVYGSRNVCKNGYGKA